MVAQITTDLRLLLLRSILSARWAYFVRQPIGRLANAMTSEPMRASEAYVRGVTVVTLLMQTCIYTSVAFLVSWKATLVSLIAGVAILSLPFPGQHGASCRQATDESHEIAVGWSGRHVAIGEAIKSHGKRRPGGCLVGSSGRQIK